MLRVLILLLLVSCSTTVPVTYRKASESSLPKGTSINVFVDKTSGLSETDQLQLVQRLNTAISIDEWFTLSDKNKSSDFELTVQTYVQKDSEITASESTRKEDSGEKTIRNAYAEAMGESRFQLFDTKKKISSDFYASAKGVASSEVTLPKETNMKAPLSVIGLMLGYDRVQVARDKQDQELSAQAQTKLRDELPRAILSKITPEKITVRLELDTDEDDMDTVKDFVSDNDLDSAYNYLVTRSQTEPRGDILYNLGVIQEARGQRQEGCVLYERAYNAKKSDLYLKQFSACKTRYQQQAK